MLFNNCDKPSRLCSSVAVVYFERTVNITRYSIAESYRTRVSADCSEFT